MTEDLKKSLESLRTLSPKLNKATDAASEIVAVVETFLNDECSLGLPCAVEVETETILEYNEELSEHNVSNTYDDIDKTTYLGYDRYTPAGGFRIVVKIVKYRTVRSDEIGVDVDFERPWAECPRDLKLLTFPELPALITKITETAEQAIDNATKASKAVTQLADALKT